jgi:hypothetical protein
MRPLESDTRERVATERRCSCRSYHAYLSYYHLQAVPDAYNTSSQLQFHEQLQGKLALSAVELDDQTIQVR